MRNISWLALIDSMSQVSLNLFKGKTNYDYFDIQLLDLQAAVGREFHRSWQKDPLWKQHEQDVEPILITFSL